jgi:hypothetical protein
VALAKSGDVAGVVACASPKPDPPPDRAGFGPNPGRPAAS